MIIVWSESKLDVFESALLRYSRKMEEAIVLHFQCESQKIPNTGVPERVRSLTKEILRVTKARQYSVFETPEQAINNLIEGDEIGEGDITLNIALSELVRKYTVRDASWNPNTNRTNIRRPTRVITVIQPASLDPIILLLCGILSSLQIHNCIHFYNSYWHEKREGSPLIIPTGSDYGVSTKKPDSIFLLMALYRASKSSTKSLNMSEATNDPILRKYLPTSRGIEGKERNYPGVYKSLRENCRRLVSSGLIEAPLLDEHAFQLSNAGLVYARLFCRIREALPNEFKRICMMVEDI